MRAKAPTIASCAVLTSAGGTSRPTCSDAGVGAGGSSGAASSATRPSGRRSSSSSSSAPSPARAAARRLERLSPSKAIVQRTSRVARWSSAISRKAQTPSNSTSGSGRCSASAGSAANQRSGIRPRLRARAPRAGASARPRSTVPFAAASTTRAEASSRTVGRSCGSASRRPDSTSGSSWSAKCCEEPIVSCVRAGPWASAASASSWAPRIRRAAASSSSPAGVSTLIRPRRSNSGEPTTASSRRTCWLTADCVRCSTPAARWKPPQSAIATSVRRQSISRLRAIRRMISRF